MESPIERAGRALAVGAWDEAFAILSVADDGSLPAADLESLAVAAYLVGADEVCARSWEAAHHHALRSGEVASAARCSCWLGLILLLQGKAAESNGWLARTDRLIERHGECAAAGYRLVPTLLAALGVGDPTTAANLAVRTVDLGVRFDDADLWAFGVLGHGQALIALGDTVPGIARLDEVMVSVVGGELGPVTTGIVYCAVILECMALYDVARSSEWTAALSAWCDAHPALVPFRGQCLIHRSQVQQRAGDWPTAISTAQDACLRLAEPPHPALGLAHYQEAELHRLLGDLDRAGASYRLASRFGHHPMPGLAMLEMARGEVGAAVATIRRSLAETGDPLQRLPLLAAAVEILRVAGDVPGARVAADELASTASASSMPLLVAMAASAMGAVLVAEGDPVGALHQLRPAALAFRSLRMPYEVARTAVSTGLACAELGDHTAAALELDDARTTFRQLDARLDLARVEALEGRAPTASGLSERERQVLALLVGGRTNRDIASELTISQHTVRRHVENIYSKLGVTSRAAATAYAYEHDLVSTR